MDRIFDDAEKRIDHPMDSLEFYQLLAPVVGAIECGHTQLGLPEPLRKQVDSELPLFPAEVAILEGKTYIFRDYANDDARLAGAEIRSIDDVPINRIVDPMKATIHGDGNTTTGTAWRLSHRQGFAVALYSLLGLRAPFKVEHLLRGSETKTVELAGMTAPAIRAASQTRYAQDQRPKRRGDFKLLNDGKIAYLKIYGFSGFGDDAGTVRLGEFVKRSYQQIRDAGSQTPHHSLLGGLMMFLSLYFLARWATETDPQILRFLLTASRLRAQYDPTKFTPIAIQRDGHGHAQA
jgi:hypothetical protein